MLEAGIDVSDIEYLRISETKLDFYHEGFSDYCLHLYCYFHNVSADMSSGFLQVFVELGNLNGTSNYVHYWIHGGRLLIYEYIRIYI